MRALPLLAAALALRAPDAGKVTEVVADGAVPASLGSNSGRSHASAVAAVVVAPNGASGGALLEPTYLTESDGLASTLPKPKPKGLAEVPRRPREAEDGGTDPETEQFSALELGAGDAPGEPRPRSSAAHGAWGALERTAQSAVGLGKHAVHALQTTVKHVLDEGPLTTLEGAVQQGLGQLGPGERKLEATLAGEKHLLDTALATEEHFIKLSQGAKAEVKKTVKKRRTTKRKVLAEHPLQQDLEPEEAVKAQLADALRRAHRALAGGQTLQGDEQALSDILQALRAARVKTSTLTPEEDAAVQQALDSVGEALALERQTARAAQDGSALTREKKELAAAMKQLEADAQTLQAEDAKIVEILWRRADLLFLGVFALLALHFWCTREADALYIGKK